MQCGHTSNKRLSTCRGTYPQLYNARFPRCNAPGPSLIMSYDTSCLPCQHKDFVAEWEDRLDKVRERRDLLHCALGEEESSGDCLTGEAAYSLSPDYAAESNGTPHFAMEGAEDASPCEGDCNGWCSDSDCLSKPRAKKHDPSKRSTVDAITSNWLDTASLRNECNNLTCELADLQAAYEQAAWQSWNETSSRGTSMFECRKRGRFTGPKVNCNSPLRKSTSTDEIQDPSPLRKLSPTGSTSSGTIALTEGSDNASTISTFSVRTPRGPEDRILAKPLVADPFSERADLEQGTCSTSAHDRTLADFSVTEDERPRAEARAPSLDEDWRQAFQRVTWDAMKAQAGCHEDIEVLLPDWGIV